MVENYLRKQEETNTVTAFSEPVRGSKPAKTGFLKLAEQTVFAKKEGSRIPISLAAARLYTGRSHQLRVHFAGLGHPVLLDDKYGDGALNRSLRNAIPAKALPPGQLLHCARIEFPERDDLPQALRKKTLTAAPPAVFALLFPGVEAAQTGEGISQRP